MPAVLITVAKSLIFSLFTEAMLKWLIIWSLEKVVEKTKETWDDELLSKAKEAWKIETK